MSENSSPTEGSAEPINSASPARSKRNGHLKVVDDAVVATGNEVVATSNPPMVSRMPAVDPVSEFRAAQTRRRMDAQAEIEMIDKTMEHRKARYDAILIKLDDQYRRAIESETDQFTAEWTSLEDQRNRQRIVLEGAEAALAATISSDRAPTD